MKNSLFYIAMSLILLSTTFTFKMTDFNWLWADQPQVPMLLLTTAAICLGIFFSKKNERKSL